MKIVFIISILGMLFFGIDHFQNKRYIRSILGISLFWIVLCFMIFTIEPTITNPISPSKVEIVAFNPDFKKETTGTYEAIIDGEIGILSIKWDEKPIITINDIVYTFDAMIIKDNLMYLTYDSHLFYGDGTLWIGEHAIGGHIVFHQTTDAKDWKTIYIKFVK